MNKKNICRICSSKGEYDIFSVIPAFLHSSPNEFVNWSSDISEMLEQTTGLRVSPADGLPEKICALCISYLKHAVIFRQQAINNVLSLKAAELVISGKGTIRSSLLDDHVNNNDKGISAISIDSIFKNACRPDSNALVNNNVVWNNQNKNDEYFKKQNDNNTQMEHKPHIKNLKTYLNLLFDKKTPKSMKKMSKRKNNANFNSEMENNPSYESFINNFLDYEDGGDDDPQTGSSDENEMYEQKINYFSYKEKNFQEDDIMTLDELKEANIIINIPEHFKERKCRACFRRFMFEDSYKEHTNICIEYKFILLIEEINRLLVIRRNKTISPHEFMRRMIFSLKKICKWLSTSCGEVFPPNLLGNTDLKRSKSEGKSSGAENSSCKSDDNKTQFETFGRSYKPASLPSKSTCKQLVGEISNELSKPDCDNPLFELLKEKADPVLIRNVVKTPDPLLELLRQKEESTCSISAGKWIFESTNSDSSACPESISEGNNMKSQQSHTSDHPEIERKSLLDKFNKVADKPALVSVCDFIPINPKISFSARCSACSTTFEKIAALEEHNAIFHNNKIMKPKHLNNNRTKSNQRNNGKSNEYDRIIALFESNDDPSDIEGTVDVLQGNEISSIEQKSNNFKDKFASISVKNQSKKNSPLEIRKK